MQATATALPATFRRMSMSRHQAVTAVKRNHSLRVNIASMARAAAREKPPAWRRRRVWQAAVA